MADPHASLTYELTVRWTGNAGPRPGPHAGSPRSHEVRGSGKPSIPASAGPRFDGEPGRWNPEELLVSSLAQCHMLWYLRLCDDADVVVTDYVDRPRGSLTLDEAAGGGRFTEVLLRPQVTVAESAMEAKAATLHADVSRLCPVARSVSFPVRHEPIVRTERRRRTG